MIRVEFDNSDCGNFYKNYPNIKLELPGTEYSAAYVAEMFRNFMLAVGYQPNTVDSYIPDMGCIEMHLDEIFDEGLSAFSDEAPEE